MTRHRSEATNAVGKTKLVPALLLALFLAVACAGRAPLASPRSSAPVVCGGGDTCRFADEVLEFDYPTAWHAATYNVSSSFSMDFLYLSTAPMSDPCDHTPSVISCTRLAAAALGTNGVLATWSMHGFPGWVFDTQKGSLLNVGQHQASMASGVPSIACQDIGGVDEIIVTMPRSASANWAQFDACLAGPDVSVAHAQVEAMLKTVVWKQW